VRPNMIIVSDEMIPAGTVTTADLYRELIGMRVDVARALTLLAATDRINLDHESRLRQLERFRYVLLGATITVSAVVSALGAWIANGIARPLTLGRVERRLDRLGQAIELRHHVLRFGAGYTLAELGEDVLHLGGECGYGGGEVIECGHGFVHPFGEVEESLDLGQQLTRVFHGVSVSLWAGRGGLAFAGARVRCCAVVTVCTAYLSCPLYTSHAYPVPLR
jgi:hypothetical protein